MTEEKIVQIAKICHEANKAYCETIDDYSQRSWEGAGEWQRQSAINGVKFALNGVSNAKDQHESWMKDKLASGWKYGPVKDANKKEHPCIVPYSDLPKEQKVKDFLFRAIVGVFED